MRLTLQDVARAASTDGLTDEDILACFDANFGRFGKDTEQRDDLAKTAMVVLMGHAHAEAKIADIAEKAYEFADAMLKARVAATQH